MPSAFACRGLEKRYGDKVALGGVDLRVELFSRGRDGLPGHPQALELYAVEAMGRLADRRETMIPDRRHDGTDLLDRHGDVELGTGQQAARVPVGAAQVGPIQHATSLGGVARATRPRHRRPSA